MDASVAEGRVTALSPESGRLCAGVEHAAKALSVGVRQVDLEHDQENRHRHAGCTRRQKKVKQKDVDHDGRKDGECQWNKTPEQKHDASHHLHEEEEGYLDGSKRAVDPWDNEYRIECQGTEILVTSAGPDEQFDTEDDISGPDDVN